MRRVLGWDLRESARYARVLAELAAPLRGVVAALSRIPRFAQVVAQCYARPERNHCAQWALFQEVHSMDKLEITVTKFRSHLDERENVTLLGFATLELRVPDAVENDQGELEDFTLVAYDVNVKLLNGKPRIDFRRVPGRREGTWFDTSHPGSAASRGALTDAVFAHQPVRRAAQRAIQGILDREQSERFATGTDAEIPY